MKRHLLSIVTILFGTVTFVSAQSHSDAERTIKQFMSTMTKEQSVPKGTKSKKIDCSQNGYVIEGIFAKGKLLEDYPVTVTSNDGNIILHGRYAVIDGFNTITGRYQYESGGKMMSSYGTFIFSNGPSQQLILKPKKAKGLNIEDINIIAHKGWYNNNPAIIRKNQITNIWNLIIEGDNNWTYTRLTADISAKDVKEKGYKNIASLLMSELNNVTAHENNIKFKGNVECSDDGTGNIKIILLDGTKTGFQDKSTISVNNVSSQFAMTISKPNSNNETFFLPENFQFNPDSLWSINYFMSNSEKIRIIYKSGNTYTGNFKSVNGKMNITDGLFVYANGDKFIGDLSAAHFGCVPVSGKTAFKDGTIKEGNYIVSEYKTRLTTEQLSNLAEMKSLSDPSALIAQADKFVIENIISKARVQEKQKKYNAAIDLYNEALSIKEDDSISSKITELTSLLNKQKLIDKYGTKFGNNIFKGIIEVGMTKEMVKVALDGLTGFYRISTRTNLWNEHIETWEFDHKYGISNMQTELIKQGIEEQDKMTTALGFGLMGIFEGIGAGELFQSKLKYKYLKFKDSVLVEVRDSSVYDEINTQINELDNLLWMLQ